MRKYRIMIRVAPERPTSDEGGPWPSLIELGLAEGHDAKAAIEAALGKFSSIGETIGERARAIAVPTTNWSELEVEPDPRPQFKVRQIATAEPTGDRAES